MWLSWKWQIGLIMAGGLLVGYFMLKPSYEIKQYKLGFYPYVYLTRMVYWSLGDRQLIYIYGKHEEQSYPDKDYIVQHGFAGFDASSTVIAVCDSNQRITINFNDGFFEAPLQSKNIKAYMVGNNEWVRLDTNQIGLKIEAY